MPQICDMGQTALLPFRRKACWGFFRPKKIRRLRPGLNPRTWVLEASMLTNRPPLNSNSYNTCKQLDAKCVFWVLLLLVSITFPIITKSERYYHKRTKVLLLSTHYFCQILIRLEFSRQIFKKKNLHISNFMKIVQCRPSHSMRWSVTKISRFFADYANALKCTAQTH
jgi:hypothetical protein